MKRLTLLLMMLLAVPALGDVQYPADHVYYDDGETLQSKLDGDGILDDDEYAKITALTPLVEMPDRYPRKIWYSSFEGGDEKIGSYQEPKQTWQHALRHAQSGDDILLKHGTDGRREVWTPFLITLSDCTNPASGAYPIFVEGGDFDYGGAGGKDETATVERYRPDLCIIAIETPDGSQTAPAVNDKVTSDDTGLVVGDGVTISAITDTVGITGGGSSVQTNCTDMTKGCIRIRGENIYDLPLIHCSGRLVSNETGASISMLSNLAPTAQTGILVPAYLEFKMCSRDILGGVGYGQIQAKGVRGITWNEVGIATSVNYATTHNSQELAIINGEGISWPVLSSGGAALAFDGDGGTITLGGTFSNDLSVNGTEDLPTYVAYAGLNVFIGVFLTGVDNVGGTDWHNAVYLTPSSGSSTDVFINVGMTASRNAEATVFKFYNDASANTARTELYGVSMWGGRLIQAQTLGRSGELNILARGLAGGGMITSGYIARIIGTDDEMELDVQGAAQLISTVQTGKYGDTGSDYSTLALARAGLTNFTLFEGSDFYNVEDRWPAFVAEVGTVSAIDAANDDFTIDGGHNLLTGDGPLLLTRTATGDAPTGLGFFWGAGAPGAEYWAIKVDFDEFQLASSYANAIAGTAIDFTAAGSPATLVVGRVMDRLATAPDHPAYNKPQGMTTGAFPFPIVEDFTGKSYRSYAITYGVGANSLR